MDNIANTPSACLVRKRIDAAFLERSTGTPGDWTFVLSTETPDLMGDILVQAGMEPVSDRIPAQVNHSGRVQDIIGGWRRVHIYAKRTYGDLHLLEPGINRMADLVRAMLEAGLRMAASVGCKPLEYEPIYKEGEKDRDASPIGFKFLRWQLVEASVVVVPANPEALSIAKSLIRGAADRAALELLVKESRRDILRTRALERAELALRGRSRPL